MSRKSNKKPFIDKKKSVTFQLVHRSLRDPLAADDEAPQRVLLPYGCHQKIPDSVSECGTYEFEEMISERKKFGIGFEDGYDYMQHLRVAPENQPAILVPSDKHSMVEIEESNDGMSEIFKDNHSVLKLPSSVFGSTVEEPVGLLFRAIPPVGPQPSWDPDIVAGIDDDFDFENPNNQLEDDFVVVASHPDEGEDPLSNELIDSDMDSDFDDDYEETKSRFTNYSLTSSAIRRNDQLTLLDDKFERFFESYDADNVGDLSQVEIEGAFPVDDVNRIEGMKILLGMKDMKKKKNPLKVIGKPEWNKHYLEQQHEVTSDVDDDDMITIEKTERDSKWDCETILSTYSTLYNHPKVIEEPITKVKVSGKTGIPVDERPMLTKQQLKLLDDDMEVERKSTSNFVRNNDETREEKNLRKRSVKEAKRERRREKKATKLAFKDEKTRQGKELLNIRTNLSGIRIS